MPVNKKLIVSAFANFTLQKKYICAQMDLHDKSFIPLIGFVRGECIHTHTHTNSAF